MAVSVEELFNLGKASNQELCEDLYVINNNHVAVIDGATNISDQLIDGRTPGRLAAGVIQETITNAPRDIKLKVLVHNINQEMQAIYDKFNIVDTIHEHAWMAPTASFICYSFCYDEIWQVGDCQCLIDDRHYTNEKKVDKIIAEIRSFFLETELKTGKTIEDLLVNDTSAQYVKCLTKRQYSLQNDIDNQYGFEVINGFEVDFSRVQTIKVPNGAQTIVLASDGYPILTDTLATTENLLKDLLENDPLCFREYKSSKGLKKGNLSFDDRTYIKFRRW